MSDADGLRRRAAHLLALSKKARDDNYTRLADYIFDRAAQLFEEAKIREVQLIVIKRAGRRPNADRQNCDLMPAKSRKRPDWTRPLPAALHILDERNKPILTLATVGDVRLDR